MFKQILKYSLIFFGSLVSLILLILVLFNWPVFSKNENVKLGLTFSYRYAGEIGLDWQENYLAILDDLGVRKLRIPVYWDSVEEVEGKYDFSKIDWQLEEARKRGAEVILVVGQKVPRWPECFIPVWAKDDDAKRKASLLRMVEITVERYKNHSTIKYWQVENEPFLPFGVCPTLDEQLLDQEIGLVRKTDNSRKVIITDSGELSLWIQAASRADIFGTTMYRTIWKEGFGYFTYPIGPRFFQIKHWLIRNFADQDNAIVIELQAEPWISGWTTSKSLAEQFESMDVTKLRENVEFAKEVGFPEIYLWGGEWWYWLKVKQGHPELWEVAKELFSSLK